MTVVDAVRSIAWRLGQARWLTLLIAAAAGAGVIVAGQAALRLVPKRPSAVLATIDGAPITAPQLRAEMAMRGGEDAFATAAQRRALLDDVIRLEVLATNARKAGYLDRPEVHRAIDQLLADQYAHDAIDEPLAGLEVTDAEIQQYYRDHLAAFTLPRSVHVALIVVAVPPDATPEQRQALRRRAEEAHTLALAQKPDADFEGLANKYSDDQSTRERGGDIGWITEGEPPHLDQSVTAAILAMREANEMSPVIETPSGFYVAKLLDVHAAVTRPLPEVRTTIHQQLVREQREDRAAKLYASALAVVPVNVNEAAVAAMEAAEESAVGLSATRATPNHS
jgi:parvulin-like peptidyl-prolyl isomerase